MNQRPKIDTLHQQLLIEAFNADLKQFGQWLDIELDCDNFVEVVTTVDLEFQY